MTLCDLLSQHHDVTLNSQSGYIHCEVSVCGTITMTPGEAIHYSLSNIDFKSSTSFDNITC